LTPQQQQYYSMNPNPNVDAVFVPPSISSVLVGICAVFIRPFEEVELTIISVFEDEEIELEEVVFGFIPFVVFVFGF
ncbi:2863_t:CDS:2, partial [Ambispora gerdemannii]